MNIEWQKMKIAIISVTKNGDSNSLVLKEKLQEFSENIKIYFKSEVKTLGLNNVCKEAMTYYEAVIFISSTGIAVRGIAPFIKSKDKDPAVVVVDNSSKYAISLLSGHLGGANKLTTLVSEILGAEAIITTATDNLNIKAPDLFAKENNLIIDSLKDCKDIAALLVEGKKVGFYDEDNKLDIPKGYIDSLEGVDGTMYVTNKLNLNTSKKTLKLIRKNIVLGIGCRKDYDEDTMEKTVFEVLEKYNLDIRSVKVIGTVEIKAEEKAILRLQKKLSCDLNIFSIDDIRKVEHKYEGSDFVRKTIGVGSVCEPSVELSGAEILIDKLKLNGMTLCIGKL
ncbi:cobalt-precorrin 5A hydrolase [Clostridium ihumii]